MKYDKMPGSIDGNIQQKHPEKVLVNLIRMKPSFYIVMTAVTAMTVMVSAPSLALTPADAVISGSGVKVLLYPDGRWEYLSVLEQAEDSFVKPNNAIKAFKSMTGLYEVWSDPAKWTTDKTKSGDEELILKHSGGRARAVARAERTNTKQAGVEAWVLEWARRSDQTAELSTQKKISVNGVEVMRLQIVGREGGAGTVFYGYCWQGKAGYVQLMTMTTADEFDNLKSELDELLNGLVINRP